MCRLPSCGSSSLGLFLRLREKKEGATLEAHAPNSIQGALSIAGYSIAELSGCSDNGRGVPTSLEAGASSAILLQATRSAATIAPKSFCVRAGTTRTGSRYGSESCPAAGRRRRVDRRVWGGRFVERGVGGLAARPRHGLAPSKSCPAAAGPLRPAPHWLVELRPFARGDGPLAATAQRGPKGSRDRRRGPGGAVEPAVGHLGPGPCPGLRP